MASAILITSNKRQIKTLEEQRLVLQERIQKCGEFDSTVTETARTAFQFFAKPYQRWVSGDISVKRLVLKTTFARPLTYDRKEGYRTKALSLPFSLFREFSDTESEVVPRKGLEPSHLAALAPEASASTNSATWAHLTTSLLRAHPQHLSTYAKASVDTSFSKLACAR